MRQLLDIRDWQLPFGWYAAESAFRPTVADMSAAASVRFDMLL